jgi:hypothetical protein
MKMIFKMLPIFLAILILGGCGNDDERRDREEGEKDRLERAREALKESQRQAELARMSDEMAEAFWGLYRASSEFSSISPLRT